MDAFMTKIFRRMKETKKLTHPWKRQIPFTQPYYSFSAKDETWQQVHSKAKAAIEVFTGSTFTVLSWNIDFMLPLGKARMSAALDHLEMMQKKATSPCVIFLQEMVVKDLQLIQQQPWVRSSYNITDVNTEFWESGYYGTCTLVSKSLPISHVFRVHYEPTAMERDALFVDIRLPGQKSLRFVNTHLESLVADPPKRPAQLKTASSHMHASSIHASVLGGDLNAIQDFDEALHAKCNLQDACLTIAKDSGSAPKPTWGQMARTSSRNQFGLSRMDKLLYCGAVQPADFDTFGMGVEVTDDADKHRLMQEDLEAGWVTDHLGVRADFKLVQSAKLA